jgi:RNA polymerase sigma-70 factor (ECF subfamily)
VAANGKSMEAWAFALWTRSSKETARRKANPEQGHRKDLPFVTWWEDTHLQAGLTMGNLASALTLQSEEAALVAELRAGSEEAFAWLIERYHKPIFSLLARMVHDRADAADLTQEVFVKVFRGVGSFHGESSLRTWIYRIALREASNRRRWWSRHRQQEVAIEQEIGDTDCGAPVLLKDTLEDPSESPYEMAVHTENRERVEAALNKVPEPFRTTLILRDIEGFVYEEVAEMQGVNLGTVKSRLVRGRAYLRAALIPRPDGEARVETATFDIPLGEEAQ